MQPNNYHKTMRLMRARTVAPSFDAISQLVVTVPTSRRRGFFWRGLGFGLGLILLGIPSMLRVASDPARVVRGPVVSVREVEVPTRTMMSPQGTEILHHRTMENASKLLVDQNIKEIMKTELTSISEAIHDQPVVGITLIAPRMVSSQEDQFTPQRFDLIPESHFSATDVDEVPRSRFSLFASSGFNLQTTKNQAPLFSKISTGLGYRLSDNLSVSIELQYRQATLKDGSQRLVFHDSTFSHQGSSYQNVIGGFVPTSSNQSFLAGAVGLSYNFVPTAAFSPFIEFLTAASTVGPFVTERLGINLQLIGPLRATMDGELSQFLGTRSTESFSPSLGAGLTFVW